MPKNYYLVYSMNEDNEEQALKVLKSGVNVAMVFLDHLPKTYKGYKVIDADKNDLRFTDPRNVICGLVAKGRARKDESGFVKNWKKIFSKLEPVTRS